MGSQTHTQKLAIVLAFVAAALSLAAVIVGYSRTGQILATPLLGGLLMLALGIGGYARLKNTDIR
jgi:lipopolysaccharide export LptBFGC system permease protein LptF